ncbi:hypothetical protein, partial [Bacteroides heparinolyticus]|uniref:hypothetical protein n=1 Tax=Prevotella heparinolytica TaxID=28113 RepID=UPI0035A12966
GFPGSFGGRISRRASADNGKLIFHGFSYYRFLPARYDIYFRKTRSAALFLQKTHTFADTFINLLRL